MAINSAREGNSNSLFSHKRICKELRLSRCPLFSPHFRCQRLLTEGPALVRFSEGLTTPDVSMPPWCLLPSFDSERCPHVPRSDGCLKVRAGSEVTKHRVCLGLLGFLRRGTFSDETRRVPSTRDSGHLTLAGRCLQSPLCDALILQRNVLKPGGALGLLKPPELARGCLECTPPWSPGPQAPRLEKSMRVSGWKSLHWLPGDPQLPPSLLLPA